MFSRKLRFTNTYKTTYNTYSCPHSFLLFSLPSILRLHTQLHTLSFILFYLAFFLPSYLTLKYQRESPKFTDGRTDSWTDLPIDRAMCRVASTGLNIRPWSFESVSEPEEACLVADLTYILPGENVDQSDRPK